MRVCSFGSLALEYVYCVAPAAGEWGILRAHERLLRCGGKGLNQSIALARCGAQVYHAGNVGAVDGQVLLSSLRVNGVDVRFVEQQNSASGHTIIQRDDQGCESRMLFAGANQSISKRQIRKVLNWFDAGDLLLVQNEMPLLSELICAAKARHMLVALNPSPVQDLPENLPLDMTDFLFATDAEICALAAGHSLDEAMRDLSREYPHMRIVCLRAGRACALSDGIYLEISDKSLIGRTPDQIDEFVGRYLGGLCAGRSDEDCLSMAVGQGARRG